MNSFKIILSLALVSIVSYAVAADADVFGVADQTAALSIELNKAITEAAPQIKAVEKSFVDAVTHVAKMARYAFTQVGQVTQNYAHKAQEVAQEAYNSTRAEVLNFMNHTEKVDIVAAAGKDLSAAAPVQAVTAAAVEAVTPVVAQATTTATVTAPVASTVAAAVEISKPIKHSFLNSKVGKTAVVLGLVAVAAGIGYALYTAYNQPQQDENQVPAKA